MIRPTFFTVYIKTISYIKGLSPAPSWRLGLFSEGADWASHGTAKRGLGMIRGMYRV